MALTVRSAASALVRRYVIRTQLNASVNPGVKGQHADRVGKESFFLATNSSFALEMPEPTDLKKFRCDYEALQ